MQAGYFSTAWNDIKSTPGWVGKMFLLALVTFIPVFGPIAVLGYLYGWARDAAWGVQGPMPKQIFGNEDGKQYSRGFFILVLGIVLALIPMALMFIGMILSAFGVGMVGMSSSGSASSNVGVIAVMGIISLVLFLVSVVVGFALIFIQWVGSMRISIYGRISAGFQLKKIWAMIRKDTVGILKIFGMLLLLSFILGTIFTVIYYIVYTVVMLVTLGVAGTSVIGSANSGSFDGSIIGFILAAGFIGLLFYSIFIYLEMVIYIWMEAMVVRALGYWTRQFDVPAWRGQDDPMPFELQQAAQAAQAPYQQQTYAPQAQQYQQYQQYQQPVQQQAPTPTAPSAPGYAPAQTQASVSAPVSASAPAPAPAPAAPHAQTAAPAPVTDAEEPATSILITEPEKGKE